MPGPIPDLNPSTIVVGAGNAAGLFPEITPAPTPSPGPGSTSPAAAERGAGSAGRAVDVITSAPATSILGLIALAVAFLLVMTGRYPRRRANRRGQG
jgi:hypothetical protein